MLPIMFMWQESKNLLSYDNGGSHKTYHEEMQMNLHRKSYTFLCLIMPDNNERTKDCSYPISRKPRGAISLAL